MPHWGFKIHTTKVVMTTRNKERDFKYLIKSGYAFGNVVAFFLRDAGHSMADVGRDIGTTRQMVGHVVNSKSRSRVIEQAIIDVIGFDPWKTRNEG
jgi:hypothetical protein